MGVGVGVGVDVADTGVYRAARVLGLAPNGFGAALALIGDEVWTGMPAILRVCEDLRDYTGTRATWKRSAGSKAVPSFVNMVPVRSSQGMMPFSQAASWWISSRKRVKLASLSHPRVIFGNGKVEAQKKPTCKQTHDRRMWWAPWGG